MQIEPQGIKKILIVRNDRFGEFLLNIPAFRALKETYREANLSLVVNPYVQDLARLIDFVDEVIAWESKKHRFSEALKFIQELKNRNFDLCVILNPSREFNIISFLSGIPIRVGYDRKWGFLLTHKIKDKKHLGEKHEVEYNLDLVGLIGAETKDNSLTLKNEDTGLFREFKGENTIVVHPWSSDPIKQWPFDNFRTLADRLIREGKLKVIIIGGKEEAEKSKGLFNNFGSNLIDLTGKTTLRQLAELLRKTKLLISGDSGPMHLACAVGIPVVAIFRNDIPGKSAKRWGPWGQGHTVIDKSRLDDIGIEEVFEKVKEKLSR